MPGGHAARGIRRRRRVGAQRRPALRRNSQEPHATLTATMPTHQTTAQSASSPSGWSMSSARIDSMTGVIGCYSAIGWSHSGIVSTGTNALDTYGRNSRMNP